MDWTIPPEPYFNRVSGTIVQFLSPYCPEFSKTDAISGLMQLAGTDFRVLRVFDAVVRNGGFAAAQAELNISQPTISNHITALEQRLGVKLCQRGRSGFRLTEKGDLVFKATQRLLLSLDEFASDVGDFKDQLIGDLNIGLVDCIVTDPNSKIHIAISNFLKRPNNARLNLRQEPPQDLQEQVLDGRFHMGIGSFPHKLSGLDYEYLYEEKHSLYCALDHSLFTVPDYSLTLSRVQKEKIVSRGYWRNQYRKSLGFNNVSALVYQIEPQLILLMSGQYIGFLPDHYVENLSSRIKLRRLLPNDISYTCRFDLLTRKGYRRTQLIESFIADLRGVYSGQSR